MQCKIFINQFAEVKTVFHPFPFSGLDEWGSVRVAQGELFFWGGWCRALPAVPGHQEGPVVGGTGLAATCGDCPWLLLGNGIRCGSRALSARVQRAAVLGYESPLPCFSQPLGSGYLLASGEVPAGLPRGQKAARGAQLHIGTVIALRCKGSSFPSCGGGRAVNWP